MCVCVRERVLNKSFTLSQTEVWRLFYHVPYTIVKGINNAIGILIKIELAI